MSESIFERKGVALSAALGVAAGSLALGGCEPPSGTIDCIQDPGSEHVLTLDKEHPEDLFELESPTGSRSYKVHATFEGAKLVTVELGPPDNHWANTASLPEMKNAKGYTLLNFNKQSTKPPRYEVRAAAGKKATAATVTLRCGTDQKAHE